MNEKKPPSIVFVPENKLLQVMIQATIESNDLEEVLY